MGHRACFVIYCTEGDSGAARPPAPHTRAVRAVKGCAYGLRLQAEQVDRAAELLAAQSISVLAIV